MRVHLIHLPQSLVMEPKRPGLNAKRNYHHLRLTAPILANYYVDVRFSLSLGVMKFFLTIEYFFLVKHIFLYASTLS